MTRFLLSILLLPIFQYSLFAFNSDKRLSKNNIVSILSNEDSSLLLNDDGGNVFYYNGDQVSQIEFINDIDSPTFILANLKGLLLYAKANTIFLKEENKSTKEILSAPQDEKIIRAVQNENYYFVSSSSTLYQIEKLTGVVTELYKDNIENTDKLICSSEDCYLALNNIVINLSRKDIVELTVPEKISSISFHKQFGLLTLSNDQVYISDEKGERKLFPSFGTFPTGIKTICGSDRWLFLITDQSVSVFDWVNSEIKHLGEFNGYVRAKHIDQWDNLWLATNQGLWNFTANNLFDSPKINGVQITDRNNQKLDPNSLVFTKGTSLVNITPQIVYLPNTENLITEWRINNSDWRPFVKDFALSEKMLNDGENNIFIRAKSDKADYDMPYKLRINNRINTSRIPTIWYAILGLIGSLLVLSFISLFNLRTKQRESRLQIDKLKAENQLLQSKQQIDQLQMNPHFIFNALNSINGLIAKGKISESRKAISLFSKFLRQFLYQSQGEDILLEDELELLENYVKIEQICHDNKFDFEKELKDTSLLDVKVPNMIIQPFIENSIIHAFSESQHKGNIKLVLEEEDGYLVAFIIDNGIGIINSNTKIKDHKSIAVDLVRKRLAQRDKNRRNRYLEYHDNQPGTIAKIYLQRL